MNIGRAARCVVLVAVVALVVPAAAWAHAALLRTSPTASVIANGPPARVLLTYSEAVEPRFAIVSVTGAGGHQVTAGPPQRSASNPDTLFVASSLVFDALESYLHWRAGLVFHGLHCLIGPVHRDALPLLAAASLVAAAVVAAASHLVRWMRRTLRALARRRVPYFSPPVLVPARPVLAVARPASERLRTRGPPSVAVTR